MTQLDLFEPLQLEFSNLKNNEAKLRIEKAIKTFSINDLKKDDKNENNKKYKIKRKKI